MEKLKFSEMDMDINQPTPVKPTGLFSGTVLFHEMRTLAAKNNTLLIILAAIGLASLTLLFAYQDYLQTIRQTPAVPVETVLMNGRLIYGAIFIVQMIVAVCVTPWVTAGALTSERENKTLNLLKTTPLSALSILGGKALAGVCYSVLVILTTLPVQVVSLMLAEVSVAEILIDYAIVLMTVLCTASLGLFISAFNINRRKSMGLTYLITLVQNLLVPLMILIIGYQILSGSQNMAELAKRWMLPEMGLVYCIYFLMVINPLGVAFGSEWFYLSGHSWFSYQVTLSNGDPLTFLSPWIPFLIGGLLFFICLILAGIFHFNREES